MTPHRGIAPWLAAGIVAALVVSLGGSSADAQHRRRSRSGASSDTRWLVLPVVVEAEAGTDYDAFLFGDELADTMTRLTVPGYSRNVMRREEAAATFERQHSADPELGGVAAQWAAAISHAQLLMATRDAGRFRQALAALREVRGATDVAIAALGRETLGARQRMEACMLEAAALIADHHPVQAYNTLLECRRSTPLVEPDDTIAPEVRAVFDRVEEAIASAPRARLRVESHPTGCTVRVNGVALGNTPLNIPDLPQHRLPVQVECTNAPGRVHRVDLRGDTVLQVDTVRESAIRSRQDSGHERLYLSYATREDAQRDAARDAALIEDELHVEVVLVMPHDSASLRLVRVSRRLGPAVYIAIRDRSGQRIMWGCAVRMTLESQPDATELAMTSEEHAESPFLVPPPVSVRRSGWNFALGAGLMAASTVPIGFGLRNLFRDGDCLGEPSPQGLCVADPDTRAYDRYHFGPRSGLLLGVGAVGFGGGVLLLATRPIRRRSLAPAVSATRHGFELTMRGTF